MNRHRLLSCLLLFCVALSGAALAQNPTNGKVIYDNYCAGCHGANPATNKDRILNGKTYSGLIFAWTTYKNDMPYLFPTPIFSDAEIDDIASYIATKVPAGNAQFAASPTTKNFGSVAVGVQSATTTFTLTNNGTVSGTITVIGNTNAAEFLVTGGTCTPAPKTVSNGASCTIIVAFKPSATGARSGTLAVSNSGIVSPVGITLSGTGGAGATPGQLSVPGTLGFGTQTVNVQSSASTLTLTNIGGSALTMTSVVSTNAGEFPITVNSCAGSIGAGASCSVSVAFKPVAAGARSGSLTVTSTGVGSPQAVALSGTGQAAATPGQLSVPGAVTFGTQTVGTPVGQNVTLTNIGGAAVSVSSVSSTNPSEFTISGNSCAGSIGAGASCGFAVTFTPAVAGSRGATITVVSTGTGSPQSIVATGTGSAAPPPPPGQKVAVIEYYHAAFNHYFVTAIADEITKLDNGTFVGWARTGKQFNVYSTATGATFPVCRFFSTNFAPKSSHFYTPNVVECAGLMTNPDWAFEAEVFHMLTSPAGTCPGGTIPVYRLYNNGEGGAPNHRYTTEPQTKALMVGQAWVPEGNGNDVVFMCSPL